MIISANDMLFSCCLVYGSTDWIWVLPVVGHRKEKDYPSLVLEALSALPGSSVMAMTRLAFREAVKLNRRQSTCF